MRGISWAFALLVICSCTAAVASEKPLPVSDLTIEGGRGAVRLRVEVASDGASQERGLMYRRSLAANAGMLFDFHQPVMTEFWMKNTYLPLDIVFIRPNGTISSITENAKPLSETLIPSTEPVRAVLEIKGGRAKALGIAPGDRVIHAIFSRSARRP